MSNTTAASARATHSLSIAHYALCIVVAALAAFAANAAPKIVYVVPGGAGDGMGADWANAMASIKDAYASAAAFAEGGFDSGEVWIKTGRYTIDTAIAPASYVAVRGGFLGTETDASQARRDNLTIISGDKKDDDLWMPCGTNTSPLTYVWTGADKMTFTPPNPNGSDAFWSLGRGASGYDYDYGFQATSTSAPVTNCVFTGITFTSFEHRAIHLEGGPHIGIVVSNCNFYACSVYTDGALLVHGIGTVFADNVVWGGGGCIRIEATAAGEQTNRIERCTFRDLAKTHALNCVDKGQTNDWYIADCLFYRNYSQSNGNAPVVRFGGNKKAFRHFLTRCAFRENRLTGTCASLFQHDGGDASGYNLFDACDFANNVSTNATSGNASACIAAVDMSKTYFFRDCSFRDNVLFHAGSGSGASVFVTSGSSAYATFLNCSATGNRAAVVDGAAPTHSGTIGMGAIHTRLAIINSVLDGNVFSGAATNAEVFSAGSYNQELNIVNSILNGVDADYVPLRTPYNTGSLRLSPYLYRSFIRNFDSDAVGTYSYARCEDITDDGAPELRDGLRHIPAGPAQLLGIRPASRFSRGGVDIWLLEREDIRPGVVIRDPVFHKASKKYWRFVALGKYGDGTLTDDEAAAFGVTTNSPLIPDALGHARQKGAVAYGPFKVDGGTIFSVK